MWALRVNETKEVVVGNNILDETEITAEHALNRDHLWMEGNHESKNEDKTFF